MSIFTQRDIGRLYLLTKVLTKLIIITIVLKLSEGPPGLCCGERIYLVSAYIGVSKMSRFWYDKCEQKLKTSEKFKSHYETQSPSLKPGGGTPQTGAVKVISGTTGAGSPISNPSEVYGV